MNKWTNDNEKSIIKFVNEKNIEKKNKIFTNELLETIENLIELNYNKYNVFDQYSKYFKLLDIKEDILTQVYEQLQKFNPEKIRHDRSGKAYISTIIRCQLANEQGKRIKDKKMLISLDNIENI